LRDNPTKPLSYRYPDLARGITMKDLSFHALGFVLTALFLFVACSTGVRPESSKTIVPSGSWSRKAPLPISISEVAVAATEANIYVIGGSTPERVDQPTNFEYNIASNTWRERAPLPRGLTHAAAASIQGKIFVIGGFTAAGHGGAVDLVFEYDPATDSWRSRAPLTSPRGSVGVTVLNGKIHAIGGRGVDRVTVRTHEVYDPTTDRWSELAPLPKARDHLAVVAGDAFIHVIGGRLNSSAENVDLHDVYNPATNSWQSGLPLPTPRSAVAAALYQGKIFVTGGECLNKRTYPQNEAFDLKSGTWTSFAPLVIGRHGFGAVAVGKNLYFAAGATECGGGERTNELLVFSIP
jgi:hypothetical protein